MFPNTIETEIVETTATGSKSFLFDFSVGEFVSRNGQLVPCDGIEAVKVWIEKILRTEKDRYAIYEGTSYGAKLEDLLIGDAYSSAFIESELKREIEDALLQHPDISRVSNIAVERTANALNIDLEVVWNDTRRNTISVTV